MRRTRADTDCDAAACDALDLEATAETIELLIAWRREIAAERWIIARRELGEIASRIVWLSPG